MKVKYVGLIIFSCTMTFTENGQTRLKNEQHADPHFALPIDKHLFWLSSSYGLRKTPGGKKKFHFGVDMAAAHGTPVKAAGDGQVIQADNQPGYGNVVVIQHDEQITTRYAHLSKITVSLGKWVKKGEKIGNVGATGNVRSSGKMGDPSHLHFEVAVNGKRVNPAYFLKGIR